MRKISKQINPVFRGKAWACYLEMKNWKQKYNTTFEKFLELNMFMPKRIQIENEKN